MNKVLLNAFVFLSYKGKKKSHKGGHRHFTSEDDLALEAEKARKQQEWRVLRI